MPDQKCYLCLKPLRLEDGVVNQPHEGLRHQTCDPQRCPPETPALGADAPFLPEDEEIRHIRVRNASHEANRAAVAGKKGARR
jgi:hypothetical protein